MLQRGVRRGFLTAFALCSALALLAAGCGSGASSAGAYGGPDMASSANQRGQASLGGASFSASNDQTVAPADTPLTEGYQAPAFADSPFHADQAQSCGAALVDESGASLGYLAAQSQSEQAVVLLLSRGESQYKYWLPRDKSPVSLPLNLGDGDYQLRVMENISENSYAETWSGTLSVTLQDEFEPFLRPNQMVRYDAQSACVALAAQLAAQSEDSTQLVSQVYAYLVEHVAYDDEKAATVESGYLPLPDDTLATGKGICFDYASLAAAMLRSQGIPTRLITGYVSPDDLYHAWNQVYIEDKGWITVKIEAKPGGWQRMDTTFAASGVEEDYLLKDANYTDRYVY